MYHVLVPHTSWVMTLYIIMKYDIMYHDCRYQMFPCFLTNSTPFFYIYIYIYIHTYIQTYIYKHIYIHIYTQIYIYLNPVVMYRGGSLIRPENTLLAFRNAVEGVDSEGVVRKTQVLEFDIQKTKDGQLVRRGWGREGRGQFKKAYQF